tara:strand:- start:295 stop:531 length:237 start_codon:yes stop_codon:yes gene_type:complete
MKIEKDEDLTNFDKWKYTILTTIIFIIITNPITYKITNAILKPIFGPLIIKDCPTPIGIAIHTIVFILILRYIMELKI